MGRIVYSGTVKIENGLGDLSLNLSAGAYSIKFTHTSTNEAVIKKLIVNK